jgi:hypothetical protein
MRFSQRRATLRSRRGSPATFRDGALCGIALDVSRLRRSPSRGLLPRRMPSAFIDPLLDAYFHVAGGGASSSIPWSAPSSAMGSGAPGLDPLLGASFHVAGDGASSSIPWSAPSSAARSRALEVDPLLAASFHVAGGRASSSIPWSAPSSAMGSGAPEHDPLRAASFHVAGGRASSSIPLSMPSSTSQEAAPPHRSPSRCPPLPHQGTALFVDAPDGRLLRSDTEHCAARRRREFTPAAGERSVRHAKKSTPRRRVGHAGRPRSRCRTRRSLTQCTS